MFDYAAPRSIRAEPAPKQSSEADAALRVSPLYVPMEYVDAAAEAFVNDPSQRASLPKTLMHRILTWVRSDFDVNGGHLVLHLDVC